MRTFKITLIFLCFLFYSCNNKTKDKNTREFKVAPQKFDSPPDKTELKDRESFEDSIVDPDFLAPAIESETETVTETEIETDCDNNDNNDNDDDHDNNIFY
jgi:hypothetical protein